MARSPAKPQSRPHPQETTVLVLQGGGALGAYQAGVYQELEANGLRADLARRNLDRGDQRRADRRQSARAADRAPAHVLGAISSRLLAEPVVPRRADARSLFNEASAPDRSAFGLPGFFRPRVPPALAPSAGLGPGAQLSTKPRPCARPWRSSSTSTCSTMTDHSPQRRRGQCPDRQFRLFRHVAHSHRPGTHHGERRAAARFSARRDRRRVLLGRRSGLEHAAAIRARRAAASRHVRLPGRPVQRPRADAATLSMSPSGRRTSATPAGRGSTRTSFAISSPCGGRLSRLLAKLPDDLKDDPDAASGSVALRRGGHDRPSDPPAQEPTQSHPRTTSSRADRSTSTGRADREDVRRTLAPQGMAERAKPTQGVTMFDLTGDGED